MKNNKKGFTLIELLAIIVILAVIMAIAIPQVLNVVNGSKASAWKNNVKMIAKAIELNTQLYDAETGAYTYTIDGIYDNPSIIKEIAKTEEVEVERIRRGDENSSYYVFLLTGIGQFSEKYAVIACNNKGCKIIAVYNQEQMTASMSSEAPNVFVVGNVPEAWKTNTETILDIVRAKMHSGNSNVNLCNNPSLLGTIPSATVECIYYDYSNGDNTNPLSKYAAFDIKGTGEFAGQYSQFACYSFGCNGIIFDE